MHIGAWIRATAVAAVLTLGVAACGDDDDDGTTAAGDGAPAAETADGGTTAADGYEARLEAAYQGNIGDPPTSGPKAQEGKSVWVISCGEQVISCKAGSAAAMDAAKAMGWDAKLYDGEFNPAKFADGVGQAVAAKADGIILDAIDCATATSPLQQAKKAGIKIVSFYAFDCDDPNVGGEPVFDAGTMIQGSENYRDAVKDWARNSAAWIAAKLEGKAKVIMFEQDELLVVKYIREGFQEGMKEDCPTCEIVEVVPITGTDVGPKLQQKTQSALLKNPDANAVYTLYDGLVLAGVGAGVKASGRAGEIEVVGGEGFEPNADLVRAGTGEQTAGDGFPSDWTGYHAIDTLNRLFAGEEPVESGIGWQIWDKDNNLPPSGPWVPVKDGKPVDHRAAYEKIWGVG